MGDFCQPNDIRCPHVCSSPMPSQCDADHQVCDNGNDMHGCWMGNFCQPMDVPCPQVCHNPMPSQCDENSQVCDGGFLGACWNGDWCQPNDTPCPHACNTQCHLNVMKIVRYVMEDF